MSGDQDDVELDGPEVDPPTSERVARRALVLCCVAVRAYAESEANRHAATQMRASVLNYIGLNGLDAELEPTEREFVSAELGMAGRQQVVDSSWRVEGAAVLAWALGRADLPPYEQPLEPAEIFASLDFAPNTRSRLLEAASLRAPDELLTGAHHAFALHWRLRDFQLTGKAIDFADVAKKAWFGPLEIAQLALVEGDLAIGDAPIAKAAPDRVRRATSLARERHQAHNWLCGDALLYSDVDTST